MHELARAEGLPLSRAAARLAETGGIKGKARAALEELFRGLAAWHAMLEREGHVVTVATMLDETGYTEMWKQDKSPEAPGRLENLRELVRALADFETLEGFLDHVALVMENEDDANPNRVSLMTLHGAKGLEFDTVFLPGWEEGIFPNQRSLDETGDKGLEEERRLAYVGLTRARRHAIISHAANRRIYANWQTSIPSRFLDELPDAEVERTGSGDYRRDARVAAATAFSGGAFSGGGMFPLVARRPRVIEAWEQPGPSARTETVKVGARVFHQKFGYGTVKSADDDRLDIEFDKAGEKRVLDRFVEVTADP
jgi:DNA helicase-2/ATP-dependent DNA helicase PcrA